MTELSTHVFELNLTSVCVSSGVIQLPLKMLEFFASGTVAAELDGETVDLAFQAPRRLSGLREHFGARGLRSNDRVRFSLEVEKGHVVKLTATCVKRERSRQAEAGEGEEGRPAPRGAGANSTPAGRWESVEEVRAVRRVRIPGLPTAQPPAELAAHPSEQGAVHDSETVGSRVSMTGLPIGLYESKAEDGLTTVRVRRRRQVMDEPPADRSEDQADVDRAQDDASEVVRPLAAAGAPLQLSDLIAPPIQTTALDEKPTGAVRPRNWAALTSRMRLGARPAGPQQRERPYTSGPARTTHAEGSETRERTGQKTEDRELVAATGPARLTDDTAVGVARPVSRGEAGAVQQQAVSTPRPADSNDAGERVALRSSFEGMAGRAPDSVAESNRDVRTNAPNRPSSDGSSPVMATGQTRRTASDAAPAAVSRQSAARPLMASGEVGERSEQRRVPLIDDADFGGEYLTEAEPATGNGASPDGGLEADMAIVDDYLRRPDTPAIIRAEAVGVLLGIGEERAERALERISERPDHVTRIRRGAYMVRGTGG